MMTHTVKKSIAIALIATWITGNQAFADPSQPSFIGPGYREYVQEKIQEGYSIERFDRVDTRMLERVSKRNQIEEIIAYSSQAGSASANNIAMADYEHKDTSARLRSEIAQLQGQRESVASANGEFRYVPHSDGQVDYFIDGLTSRVLNERVTDEFGNVSLKNTYNMKYNDGRLLISNESDTKDELGNVSHASWSGTYTPDSVFYADDQSNAVRNIQTYSFQETDHAGNTRATTWQANGYEGKFLRAFSQRIEDSVYGTMDFTRSSIEYATGNYKKASSWHEEGYGVDNLQYRLDRSNVSYNLVEQITGYHEEKFTTQVDGNEMKTVEDATFEYLPVANQFGKDTQDPSHKLQKAFTTTQTFNADGSTRSDINKTEYTYDSAKSLTGAVNISSFSGTGADWIEYKDQTGRIVTREVVDGTETFFYIDETTRERIAVEASLVTATEKPGDRFVGTSETQFEILAGRPMEKQISSNVMYFGPQALEDQLRTIEESTVLFNNGLVNNIRRQLTRTDHSETGYPLLDDAEMSHRTTREVSLAYRYAENGNLAGLECENGWARGYEVSDQNFLVRPYESTIREYYQVILGKPVKIKTEEEKTYLGTN